MNISVCNGDGHLAPGVAVLAHVAGEFTNVRVVAPECDRSGVSNSPTFGRPLYIKQAQNGSYYVSGTPTDCTHLGLHTLSDFRPDLVFSDINSGVSTGDDILYSGMVATTTEAYLMGIPAMALSLNNYSRWCWEAAEKTAQMMIDRLVKTPPKLPVLRNVNTPAIASDEIQGIKITRLGRCHHEQSVVPMRNPRGEPIYWIGPVDDISDREEGTDLGECEVGLTTVTPLQTDLTDHVQLEGMIRLWEGTAKTE